MKKLYEIQKIEFRYFKCHICESKTPLPLLKINKNTKLKH